MSFNDIINQQKAKEIIEGQLKSGRIPHAYLFLGQDGVGRRKTALELSRALNCQKNAGRKSIEEACGHCIACQKITRGNHPDVQTIDFVWQARLENKEPEKQKVIKIDTIRALQKNINFKPVEGRWKVYIIEPAEKITLDAANCLLKTLEEPPSWTVIILLAKHRENLPATVASRTQVVHFSPLQEHEIAGYLKNNGHCAETRAREIARMAEGSLAWALSLAGENVAAADSLWRKMKTKRLSTTELLAASQQNARNAGELLNELLAEAKTDFRRDPVRYAPAVEAIIASRKSMERNVNPQMILDVLLLKLNKHAVENERR